MDKWNNASWAEVWKMALWPHIALPHAVVSLGGVLLYTFARLQLIAV